MSLLWLYLRNVLWSVCCPRRSTRLLTLPNMKYKNHSGDQGSHLGGGSTGIGENCGALGGGPLGGEVEGGTGPVQLFIWIFQQSFRPTGDLLYLLFPSLFSQMLPMLSLSDNFQHNARIEENTFRGAPLAYSGLLDGVRVPSLC